MSFSDKKGSTHDVVNQRRESYPTGNTDADGNLPTWHISGLGGGSGGGGGGGGGGVGQSIVNQNTVKHGHKAPPDPSSSAPLPPLSASQKSPSTAANDKQITMSATVPPREQHSQVNAVNDSAKQQQMYPGLVRNSQYPYRSTWSSLPLTARPFEPPIGNHAYPSYFGSESILDQMYRGTSGSLNLVSMGLQSVSNFTGVLNQFFMAIQSTLASLMNLTSQMHFIKDQFARAMSIFSLYRGLKWLIARLQHALGLKTEDDAELAWREAASSFQTPVHDGTTPSRRPWRKAFLTMLFITVPTLIIYILDVLNTQAAPPPRLPPDGRGSAGNFQPSPDSLGGVGTGGVPEGAASTGQWPSSSGVGAGYSYSSYSPYRFGAPSSYNNSLHLNSPYGFNSPFSSSTYPYPGTSTNPYSSMGGVGGWGSYGSPMSTFNSAYGNYNGMYNRYNYGNNFSGADPFSNSSMYPTQHGYAGITSRPQASPPSQQSSFPDPNCTSKSQAPNRPDLSAEVTSAQQSK